MRALRILSLQFQHAFEYRSRIFVWFLLAFLNPLMMLIFWRSAIAAGGGKIGEFTLSSISTYYFLLIMAASFLVVHMEEAVALLDIKEGRLTMYLLKPISYFKMKFIEELPWRIVQGLYGVLAVIVFYFILHMFDIVKNPYLLLAAFLIAVMAYLISFTYKMCIGLIALWVIDVHGFFQVMEVIMIVFAGMVIPISLMPPFLEKISHALPFSYMIYFPVIAFQGKLSGQEIVQVLGIQAFWLTIFGLLYRLLWRKGIYKFTAFGQ